MFFQSANLLPTDSYMLNNTLVLRLCKIDCAFKKDAWVILRTLKMIHSDIRVHDDEIAISN